MQQTSSNVAEAATTPSSSDTNQALNTLNLEILKIVKESQQQHGLRHADFQRYRHYCSRRLRRLRKTLHVVCGTSKKFAKREIQEDDLMQARDNKLLLVPLFLCERAWALAMQLKQEANTDPRKKFHMANRLRKAVRFARHLEKLSQSARCDARTKIEAQGYVSLINGQFCFEVQKWKESLNYFNLAKNIYTKLSEALKGDDSQVYYTQKVDEIEPNIRYCNYKLGDKSAQKDLIDMKLRSGAGSELAEAIDILISQTKDKQVATFSELQWRNKISLQVKNEKVRMFLVNVQELEKEIQASTDMDVKISIYEKILKESVDVIQLLRDELKLDQNFQTIQRGQVLQSDDKPSNLLLLFSYLTWLRINKTIERNLLMADSLRATFSKQQQEQTIDANTKSVKPQSIVRLYDIILQNFKDMSNLPGILYDKQAQSDIDIQCLYYRTLRAFYIGQHYLVNKKFKEAIGFCFRVEAYLKQLEPQLASFDLKKTEIDVERVRDWRDTQLKQLRAELSQFKSKVQTNSLLDDDAAAATTNEKTPRAAKNVVKTALDFEPIPCKPLFFDLALNHVELPSFEDKIDAKKQTTQSSGLKGFVKGFFGYS